jgi:predicted GNAT family acetyltransferase
VNRPYFEKQIQVVLRRRDMANLGTHYSLAPSSGFWILEFNGHIIGIIAIDASPEPDESSADQEKKGKKKKTPEQSSVAIIRHFYVDEQYRPSGVQDDLLAHAVKHAFTASSVLLQIRAEDSPLTPYIRKSLKSAGFELEQHTETVGVFKWKLGMRVLERSEWESRTGGS